MNSKLNSKFLKISLGVGVSTVIKIIITLVIFKFIAIKVGPQGFALSSKLNNFVTILQALSIAGISSGIVKYISGADSDDTKNKYVDNSLIIIIIFTLLSSCILIIFNNYWGEYLFNKSDYNLLVILLAVSLPFSAANNYFISILNGLKKYRILIFINIFNSIISLLISLFLIYNFAFIGSLISIVIFQSLIYIFSLLYIVIFTNLFHFRSPFLNYDFKAIRNLLLFSTFSLISILNIPLGQLLIRNDIIQNLGIENAGYWDGMTKISIGLVTLINTSLSAYYIPKLSSLVTKDEIRKELIQTGLITMAVTLVFCIFIFILRSQVIIILYNKQFLKIAELFLPQLIGDFFRLTSWLFACLLIAKAKIKEIIIFEIVFSLLVYVILSKVFLKYYGFAGPSIAYACTYILYFLSIIIYSTQKLKFHEFETVII